MKIFRLGISVAALAALVACGGGNTAKNATQNSMQGAQNAMQSMAQVAPIPADLHCGAVKPVWVNTHSHTYHEPNSPYYGRTKYGQYMCPSTAAAQGFHPAGGAMSGHHGSRP